MSKPLTLVKTDDQPEGQPAGLANGYVVHVDPAGLNGDSNSYTVVTVRDAETGDWVEVTTEMQARAAAARRHIEMATLVKAVALKTVADERLYLADGCSSFKDWVHIVLGTSYASAKEYCKIGRRIAPLMPALTDGDGLAGDAPQLGEGYSTSLENDRVGAVSNLGFEKLRYLTRLDEARFTEVVERGVVTLDGEAFTLDELQEMSARELAARVRDETAVLRDKVQELRAQSETLEAEKKALLDEQASRDREIADARALEAELRPRALGTQAKRDAITACHDQVNRLNVDLVAIGVTPDDPATLQHDMIALVAKLDGVLDRVRSTYHDVQAALLGLDG